MEIPKRIIKILKRKKFLFKKGRLLQIIKDQIYENVSKKIKILKIKIKSIYKELGILYFIKRKFKKINYSIYFPKKNRNVKKAFVRKDYYKLLKLEKDKKKRIRKASYYNLFRRNKKKRSVIKAFVRKDYYTYDNLFKRNKNYYDTHG